MGSFLNVDLWLTEIFWQAQVTSPLCVASSTQFILFDLFLSYSDLFYFLVVGIQDCCCVCLHSVGLLWTRDRLRRKDLYVYSTQQSQEKDIHNPAGFEIIIPANERPQIHALDRAATGIGCIWYDSANIFRWKVQLWSSSLCNYLQPLMCSSLL